MQIFSPTDFVWSDSRLADFLKTCGLADLGELQAWAVQAPSPFWRAVAQEVGLAGMPGGDSSIDQALGAGRFNHFWNLLGQHGQRSPESLALFTAESGAPFQRWTFQALADEVSRVAAALLCMGVTPNTPVGVELPPGGAWIVTFLALVSIGAEVVWSPPDVGAQPDAAARDLTSCQMVIGLQHRSCASLLGDGSWVDFSTLLARTNPDWAGRVLGGQEGGLRLVDGTQPNPMQATTLPTAGLMLKAAWDLAVALDVRRGDVVMIAGASDWPMLPWLVLGAFQLGAGVVMDPGPGGMNRQQIDWKWIQRFGVTHLGFTRRRVESLMAQGPCPWAASDPGPLRVLAVVDAPVSPAAWNWLFQQLGRYRLPVVSCYGALSLGGLLLAGFPGLPLKPSAFSGPIPGVDVVCPGVSTSQGDGRSGDLLVNTPWPGFPVTQSVPVAVQAGVRVDVDGYWFIDA